MKSIEKYYCNKRYINNYEKFLKKQENLAQKLIQGKDYREWIKWTLKMLVAVLLLVVFPNAYVYMEILGVGKYYIGAGFAIFVFLYLLWNTILISWRGDKFARNGAVISVSFMVFWFLMLLSEYRFTWIMGEIMGLLALSSFSISIIVIYILNDIEIYEKKSLGYKDIQPILERQQTHFRRLNYGFTFVESLFIFLILLYATGTDEKYLTIIVGAVSLFVICVSQILEQVREAKMEKIHSLYNEEIEKKENKKHRLQAKKIKALEKRIRKLESKN